MHGAGQGPNRRKLFQLARHCLQMCVLQSFPKNLALRIIHETQSNKWMQVNGALDSAGM